MAFIGLDRGIVDHWIYQDAEYFKVWFEMLYRARYSKESSTELIEGQLIEMNYGEFIFGRIKWSQRLKVSERRLRTLLDKMINDNMIEVVSKQTKFTVYRIINYSKYNQHNDQQQTNDGQGFEDGSDQHNDQQATSKRPADDQQATTKEQGSNKDNKVTKKQVKTYTSEFDEFWSVYPRTIGKMEAFKTWTKVVKAGESPAVIIQCASNYAQYCEMRQTAAEYMKHPKTFLNEERYKDYLVVVLPQKQKTTMDILKDRLREAKEEEAKRNGEGGNSAVNFGLFG